MSTAAPHDGGSNPANFKEDVKHPADHISHKVENLTLHDLKVKAIHKK